MSSPRDITADRRTPGGNRTGSRAGLVVAAVVAVVIGIAAVVAITVTGPEKAPTDVLAEVQAVTVTGAPLPVFDAAAADPAVGMAAPVLAGSGFTGNAVSTAPGAPTLLVFLAHWCSHCQYEVPQLVRWHGSDRFPADLDVIAVATSTSATNPNYPPSAWLAREEWPALWPVLADSAAGEAAAAFGLTGFPFMVLVDADGTVRWRHSGRIEAADLTAAIEAALR